MKSSGTTPKISVAEERKFRIEINGGCRSIFKGFLHSFDSLQLIMRSVTFVLNWTGVHTGSLTAQGQNNIPFHAVKLTLGGFKTE